MENEKGLIFTWQDYLIIATMMLISAGIGVYYRFTGGKQKTLEEYFSANRQMNAFTVGVAMMVSFISAITILGVSAEVYTFGFRFIFLYGGSIIGTFIVSYIYLPVFFEFKNMSVYEYLEHRFGLSVRLATSIANYIQLTLYTGVVLYAPSLAIEATTGLSSKTSISIIAAICIFYSTLGGIKAVFITDILQAFLMFASVISLFAVASNYIEGGFGNVWNIATQGNRTDMIDFRLDPTIRHTSLNLLIAGFFIYLSLFGVNQVEVQRLLTVKSLRHARIALFVNLPLIAGICIITAFSGLVLYAVYKDCDPRKNGDIASNDRIMPYFAATKMVDYPGLTGLFVSGIFSATLSTISAMLNSLAAVFLEDYIKRMYIALNRTFPENRDAVVGKILVLLNGCVCVTIAFIAESLGSITTLAITITGAICGPVFGIFTLGMLFEGANEIGAFVGIIVALIIVLWAGFGQPRPRPKPLPTSIAGCNNIGLSTNLTSTVSAVTPALDESQYFYLYRISYMWYCAIGVVITVVLGLIVSYIFRLLSRKPERELDPRLFAPCIARRIRKRRADVARTTSSQLFALEERNVRRFT